MAKYKKIYISIILGLILLVSGLFYLHPSTQKVGAESPEAYIITDGCFDCYTDSEYFYDSQTKQEDRTKELKNYPKYFSNRFKSNVEGKTDEWILGFVPEDLFIHIGQYFYIGRTYGFFIDNKGSEQFIYLFDIIIGTNEVSDGCIEVKLMPFFYHTYYYNQGEITIRSYEEDNFVIKDVSFGAGLSNITYANKGDETYNANNDNGSFLIASEYYYNGRSLKEDLSQPEETGRKIFSSLTVGALKMGGKLYPPLAVVGTVFDIALKIPDLVQSGLSTIFKFTPEYSEMYVFLTRGDVNNTLSNKITLYEIEDGALSEKASADYNKYVQLKISLKANSIYYIKVDIKNANNQALIFWAEYAEKTHESNYTAEREIQTGTGIIRQKIKVNQSTIIRFISPEEGTYRFFVDKKIEDSTYDVCLFIGEQINGKKLEVSKIYDNSTVNEYLITCNSGITYYFVVSNINDTIEPAINFSIVKAYENISLKIRLDEEGRNFYNNDSDIVEVAICNRYELGLCAGNQLLANSLIYSITSGSMYATLDENLITINGNGLNQTITLAVSYYYST